MASNFQLFNIRNRDNLHLSMHGDFDGTSAFELITALLEKDEDYFTVFIDTNEINEVYSFGIEVLKKNLNLPAMKKRNLIFIGKHRQKFWEI